MNNCYLCGSTPAEYHAKLKDTFTNHNLAKYPQSKYLCERCNWSLNLICTYENPHTKKVGKLYARNWSWLISKDKSYPVIDKETVSELPTRGLIRDWLINPPEPPFTIAIAESGQKHILFLSKEAQDKEVFPVLFEHDLLTIDRLKFIDVLTDYEALMKLGLTKTEINSGNYKIQNLMKIYDSLEFRECDNRIGLIRGSRYLEFVSYLAINLS